MIPWLLGSLIVGLVALYLTNPPQRPLDVSAARFFGQLPEQPNSPRLRLSLRRLVTSPLFWLQLLVLALLLATLLAWQTALAAELGPRHIGLLLVVDTSASMSTMQEGAPRIDKARQTALAAALQSFAATQGGGWCARLARVDLAWQELGVVTDPGTLPAMLASLAPQPLGTDVNIIRRAVIAAQDEHNQQCAITHVVVITDQPVPSWHAESHIPVIWQDVGVPVPSVGITELTPVRNQLSGAITAVQYQITAFGKPPATTILTINGPGGPVLTRPYTWGETRVWEDSFAPSVPGNYTLSIAADGAYAYDDSATLSVPVADPIHLDWRLSDTRLLTTFGWVQDTQRPLVRVVASNDLATVPQDPSVPLLVVGPGYNATSERHLIGYFDEASPLLRDLNLDVAEQTGMTGAQGLPQDFFPVLTGRDQAVWIAARADPAAIYVSGPPLFRADNVGSFSQTVFFNALRELLGRRTFPQLYSLTSPESPVPEGNRLALHPGEGDTSGTPLSAGSLDDWASGTATPDHDRLWPPLLVVALCMLVVERLAAFFGGRRWN